MKSCLENNLTPYLAAILYLAPSGFCPHFWEWRIPPANLNQHLFFRSGNELRTFVPGYLSQNSIFYSFDNFTWRHTTRFAVMSENNGRDNNFCRVPAVARHCRQLAIILKSGDYFFQKTRKNGESLNEKVGAFLWCGYKKCIWLQLWLLIAIFQLEPCYRYPEGSGIKSDGPSIRCTYEWHICWSVKQDNKIDQVKNLV